MPKLHDSDSTLALRFGAIFPARTPLKDTPPPVLGRLLLLPWVSFRLSYNSSTVPSSSSICAFGKLWSSSLIFRGGVLTLTCKNKCKFVHVILVRYEQTIYFHSVLSRCIQYISRPLTLKIHHYWQIRLTKFMISACSNCCKCCKILG